MTNKLYIVMPTKNEANRHLLGVLVHAFKITPNIFVYDDKSDDNTVEIAKESGANVAIRSDDVPSFIENEGEFRQGCWNSFESIMRPQMGEFILMLDADEKLYGYEHLPTYLNQDKWDVLGVSFYHMWNETHYRVDKAWAPTVSSRLFRYFPGGSYSHRRLACGAEPEFVQVKIREGRALWQTPFGMQHLGYIKDEDKRAKYERYSTLDKGEFHSGSHIESILDSNPTLVKWGKDA